MLRVELRSSDITGFFCFFVISSLLIQKCLSAPMHSCSSHLKLRYNITHYTEVLALGLTYILFTAGVSYVYGPVIAGARPVLSARLVCHADPPISAPYNLPRLVVGSNYCRITPIIAHYQPARRPLACERSPTMPSGGNRISRCLQRPKGKTTSQRLTYIAGWYST